MFCAPVYADFFCVCVFCSHSTQMFHDLSYQGNLVSVGVPLNFGAISILYPLLTVFSRTLLQHLLKM